MQPTTHMSVEPWDRPWDPHHPCDGRMMSKIVYVYDGGRMEGAHKRKWAWVDGKQGTEPTRWPQVDRRNQLLLQGRQAKWIKQVVIEEHQARKLGVQLLHYTSMLKATPAYEPDNQSLA